MKIEIKLKCLKCKKKGISFERDMYESYGWIKCPNCGYTIEVDWYITGE